MNVGIADPLGSSPAQTDDSALHKRGRSADVDEQSSPRRAKKPKPAGTNPICNPHPAPPYFSCTLSVLQTPEFGMS